MEWKEAAASLAEAEATLTTGAAADGLRQRVADMRQRIESGRMQTQRMENLFRGLDDARMAKSTWVGTAFDYAGASAKYAAAFAKFGLEVHPGQEEVLAQRIRSEEPAVREALIVALDYWVSCERSPLKAELRVIVRAADHDEWRRDYRRAAREQDGAALVRLSKGARRRTLPPGNLQLLGLALYGNDQREEARDLLRWGHALHPTDFWIALDLGNCLHQYSYLDHAKAVVPVDLEEQIGCYRVAVALRPDASVPHYNLGTALYAKNQLDDAIAEYNKAIALDPQNAWPHSGLGNALQAKNQLDDAIAEHKKVIALIPQFAEAYNLLARALYDKNQLDDAIAEYKKAIALDPKKAHVHYNLGNALYGKNQLDDAIAEYEKAITLDPKIALVHSNLGIALYAKNQLDDAIAELNIAIALDPKIPLSHSTLAEALIEKGRFAEAKTSTQKALDLVPEQDPLRPLVLRRQARCETLLALEAKLPDVFSGKAQAKDNAERLGFSEVCRLQQRPVAAAKLYSDAFTADAKLADNLNAAYRYNAACSAALAAAGQGKDADKLSDQERADLRKQALQWLRAILSPGAKCSTKTPTRHGPWCKPE